MKKTLTLGLTVCMAMSMVACGSGQSTSSTNTTEVTTPTTESSIETTEEKIELSYWSMWNEAEAQGQVISQAVQKYMEENPNVSITVNWQGRDIVKSIGTKLNAGEKIDLYDGSANTILPATIDYAMDLTELFEQSYPSTDGKAYQDVVLQATVTTTKEYSNPGEINGVPYQPFVQCIFYNKEHFEKAGITELPQTWEEFLDTCEKLKNAGYAPITVDDAYMVSLPGYYLARAKGGEWVSKLVMENDDEMWRDPAVLQMAQAYADMAEKGYFHPNVTSNIFPAGQQDLANDGASMYLNATWLVNELMPVTGPDFPWGQMQYPSVPGGEGNSNAANYASQVFVVNKESEHAEEAFKFAVYMTTGEWDAKLAEGTFGIPVGLDSSWPEQLVDAREIFVSLEEWIPFSGGIEDNGELIATIRTAFTELIGGRITPEEFVERMVGM